MDLQVAGSSPVDHPIFDDFVFGRVTQLVRVPI